MENDEEIPVNKKIIGKIWKSGNSAVVTIPDRIIKGYNSIPGDTIIIEIKKIIYNEKLKDDEIVKLK